MLLLQSWRSVLSLVHYEDSPVGPYEELAVAVLTLQGPAVTQMLVTSEASKQGGRENWGYPKELAPLHWESRGHHITFRAGAREWRLRRWGPTFPILAVGWTVQTLRGKTVRVPLRVRGWGRLAWHGRQLGLIVEHFEFTVFSSKTLAG